MHSSTHLTITNPLVKYRTLLAARKIRADPAQHRLALRLEKLYDRLKDYSPELDYRHRLDQISRSADIQARSQSEDTAKQQRPVPTPWSPLSSIWKDRSHDAALALIRTTTVHESALSIDSPRGLLLHGEVGRGKSMLLDLFAESLPTNKKRRWHFSTFILDTFNRLEKLRMQQNRSPERLRGFEVEHSVLSLAKDTVSTAPILFLDEFQLPDRATSKLLNSFLTSFFHLGGVLIASSNRMPEELAKAAGVEYSLPPSGHSSFWGRLMKRYGAERAASTDFGAFLEILKARCEVWEMEGNRDWRRDDVTEKRDEETIEDATAAPGLAEAEMSTAIGSSLQNDSLDHPLHYHILQCSSDAEDSLTPEIEWNRKIESFRTESNSNLTSRGWSPATISVYGRQLDVAAATPNGYTLWSFSDLCAASLGPADYVSLASHYHTFVLDSIPILSLIQKNEARRFITLLDALYESRCRLLIRAAAPPDQVFFPQTRNLGVSMKDRSGDEVYQETLAEIYQDSTSPFRPNISAYSSPNNEEKTSSSPTQSPPSPRLRSVLADEDADFGPVYGNGRGHGSSDSSVIQNKQQQGHSRPIGPDFTNTTALTGEDERFAFKRATSRIWEMCGQRWWAQRPSDRVDEWWRPIAADVRFWEQKKKVRIPDNEADVAESIQTQDRRGGSTTATATAAAAADEQRSTLFRHGASPFRTSPEPPPRFGWQHAWGMIPWGKRAGEWGKGVDGVRAKKKK